MPIVDTGNLLPELSCTYIPVTGVIVSRGVARGNDIITRLNWLVRVYRNSYQIYLYICHTPLREFLTTLLIMRASKHVGTGQKEAARS